jgi:hypothetical protein
MPQFPKKIGDTRILTDNLFQFNAVYISYPKFKKKSFLDLEKKCFINACSQRKICKEMFKDICGSELYTLVVSFCSKHNIFSKIITR